MFYPPSWFDDISWPASQAYSDLKFSLQMHFHVLHSVCDTTCLWVTMFVFICFSLPQSITILYPFVSCLFAAPFDAFEEPVVLAARARQWPWWRGARRSSRPGTRQGVYAFALLESKSLQQGEEIHIDNHCHCSHVFFFWGEACIAFAKTKFDLFGMLQSWSHANL